MLRQRIAETGREIEDLNMVTYCQQFDEVKSMLIVHSVADKRVPIEWSREVNSSLQNCDLVELSDYGHYGILWSNELRALQQKYFRAEDT